MPTLLTFGARNVGRVLARELAREGWSTAGVARTQETIDTFVQEVPGALGILTDATSPAEVERAFAETSERFGKVDLVVNAITNGPRGGSIVDLPDDAFDSYLQTCSRRSSTSCGSARACSSRTRAAPSSR